MCVCVCRPSGFFVACQTSIYHCKNNSLDCQLAWHVVCLSFAVFYPFIGAALKTQHAHKAPQNSNNIESTSMDRMRSDAKIMPNRCVCVREWIAVWVRCYVRTDSIVITIEWCNLFGKWLPAIALTRSLFFSISFASHKRQFHKVDHISDRSVPSKYAHMFANRKYSFEFFFFFFFFLQIKPQIRRTYWDSLHIRMNREPTRKHAEGLWLFVESAVGGRQRCWQARNYGRSGGCFVGESILQSQRQLWVN